MSVVSIFVVLHEKDDPATMVLWRQTLSRDVREEKQLLVLIVSAGGSHWIFSYIMRPGGARVQKYDEKAFVDANVVLHKQEPKSSQTSAHDVTAAAPRSSVETPESGLHKRWVWEPTFWRGTTVLKSESGGRTHFYRCRRLLKCLLPFAKRPFFRCIHLSTEVLRVIWLSCETRICKFL